MIIIELSKAKKEFSKVITSILTFDEEVCLASKSGNVVMLSERTYRSLQETLYFNQNEAYKKTLLEGLKTPYEDALPESSVKW
jgi:antitoxin YefM